MLPFGYGLHLLLNGPLMRVVKKISRLPTVLAAPRLDRLHVVGVGPFVPETTSVLLRTRRELKRRDVGSPAVQGAALLAGSGVPLTDERYTALLKGRLNVVGEGCVPASWAG